MTNRTIKGISNAVLAKMVATIIIFAIFLATLASLSNTLQHTNTCNITVDGKLYKDIPNSSFTLSKFARPSVITLHLEDGVTLISPDYYINCSKSKRS